MPTRVLTPKQQGKIGRLIKLHHAALIVELMGDRAVPSKTLKELKARGLYRKPRADVVKSAFSFGKESVFNENVMKMNTKQFEHHLSHQGITLDAQEREAVDMLRRSFQEYLKSLATAYEEKLNKAILKADKTLQRKLAQKQRRALFMELERRKALASIAKDLGDINREQLGNASRTVTTETNNAFQDGRAQEIVRKAGRAGIMDPDVFKQPRKDACEDCIKAYLEEDGKTPRVFKLSELIDNGTNIGKSRADRQPVLESFHPHCACELYWLPPGFGFDVDGGMTYVGTGAATGT